MRLLLCPVGAAFFSVLLILLFNTKKGNSKEVGWKSMNLDPFSCYYFMLQSVGSDQMENLKIEFGFCIMKQGFFLFFFCLFFFFFDYGTASGDLELNCLSSITKCKAETRR